MHSLFARAQLSVAHMSSMKEMLNIEGASSMANCILECWETFSAPAGCASSSTSSFDTWTVALCQHASSPGLLASNIKRNPMAALPLTLKLREILAAVSSLSSRNRLAS